MSRTLALFGSLFLCSTSAWADEDLPNPLTITITDAETGDRGCYIRGQETRKTGDKKSRSLMGDFGCESTFLVGKTYELRWGLTAVLAADCEGNVDCGRSDMVPFVSAFKEVKAPQEKDCWGNAKTQLDANGCAYESLKEADAALNLVYKTIRAKYSDDELFLDKLKISQRAWIAFRDAELEAFFPHQTDTRRHYGSIYPVCRSRLLTRLTTERIKQLRVWLDGAKQGASCTGSVKLKYYLDQQND